MNKLKVKDFNLNETLESGQFFNYFKFKDSYIIIERERVFKVFQIGEHIFYEGICEDEIVSFFNLDFDLNILKQVIDSQLLFVLEKYWGLRIIKQDLWQCMVGFICSSAASIPKIKKNLRLLSENFGYKVEINGIIFNTFPKPGDLNDIDLIKKSMTGYRSKYLFELNNIVKDNPQLLSQISELDYNQAKEALMKLPGIGPKVADCICLFSLNHLDAFPIDTWVKKILYSKFELNDNLNFSYTQLQNLIDENFPPKFRGYYQQYLFHFERNNK